MNNYRTRPPFPDEDLMAAMDWVMQAHTLLVRAQAYGDRESIDLAIESMHQAIELCTR
jgi:hypothetical protein